MPSLYDTLLPLLQDINDEGGNFSAFQLSKPIFDLIHAGAASDPSLRMIRDKVQEKIAAYTGKRDHLGFNQIFEAYSEGVVYLAARDRSKLHLVALSDGAKHGKTSDFTTVGPTPVGLEVKTINVFDPARTIDAAMDRGFEAGFEAEEKARAESARTGGRGVGSSITEFAPHGADAEPADAVQQTTRKIKGNLKAGQYAARPTLLVVSLARLGVHDKWCDLRSRLDVDTDCGEAASGHLFAIAAGRLGEPYFDHSRRRFGISEIGPLAEQGVLRDHDYVPAIVFLHTIWSLSGEADVTQTGFRFYGVWNDDWSGSAFTPDQRAECRRVFDQLCDGWNDTRNSQGAVIPDVGALYKSFIHMVGDFSQQWRGRMPDPDALGAFMVAADRAFFLWQAAKAERLDMVGAYTAPAADEVTTGQVTSNGRPVIFITADRAHANIPRLRLVRTGRRWEADDEDWPVTAPLNIQL